MIAGLLPQPEQCPGPMPPSLYFVRVSTSALVADGARLPGPAGGTTSAPIRASAAAIAAIAAVGSAPSATLSFAAISWCASEIRPFPAGAFVRIERSCASV